MRDKGKQEKGEKEEPIKHISEYLGEQRPFRNELLGEQILNVLFGRQTVNEEFTIKRSNNFFLYFSGREYSKSITKAEATYILELELDSYKQAIDGLFKQKRAEAFLQEIEYVVGQTKNMDVIDIIRKLFYFQELQYDNLPIESRNEERSSYAIHIQSYDLSSVLYTLIRDNSHKLYDRTTSSSLDILEVIRKEPLDYVVSLVVVLNKDFEYYKFQKETVDLWMQVVFNRFFTENLNQDNIFSKDNLYLMYFFRDDFPSYSGEWRARFNKYLCSDIGILENWLSNLIIDYGGRYGWNDYVKRSLFGSQYDYFGKLLMDEILSAFPVLNEPLSSLVSLLKYKSLYGLSDDIIKTNVFIKKFAKKYIDSNSLKS